MKSFIDSVTDFLIDKYKCNFENVEIIVPNNRTGSAILSSLQKNEKISVCWSPKITPIASIFEANSNYFKPKDEFILVYYLYNEYLKKFPNEKQNGFDDFYSFGCILLDDFDDIDKYLVDPHKLFQNLAEEAEIKEKFGDIEDELVETLKKFWSCINEDSIKEKYQKTVNLWNAMPEIYDGFRTKLEEKNIGYQGYIYRDFVEKRMAFTEFKQTNYVFVGFSALNKCERLLFRHIVEQKGKSNCLFFWDIDKYYIDNENQEAGLFLRQNCKEFPMPEGFEICDTIKNFKQRVESSEASLEIIEVPTPISQTKIIPSLLEKFDTVGGNTAIVLGDEKLLVPLIYSFENEQAENFNITMGYPLSFTTSASFVQAIMTLAAHRYDSADGNKSYFLRKDLLTIVLHHFSAISHKNNALNSITQKLNESKIEYFDIEQIKDEIAEIPLYEKVFDIAAMQESFPKYVLEASKFVYENLLVGKDYADESEFMYDIIRKFNIFNMVVEQVEAEANGVELFKNDRTFYKLMMSIIKRSNLAFDDNEEERSDKMQILGFMETRCLDFENVIMLSLNDGTFPKSTSRDSMIPYNLRKAWAMPTIEYQDSIYAYYFYRLLQRSKNVKMLYFTESVQTSEKSRFITQIDYELGFYEGDKHEYHTTKSYEVEPSLQGKIEIQKNSAIIAKIDSLFGVDNKQQNAGSERNGAYPIRINTYCECPLKFYFRYVVGLKEPDSIDKDTTAIDLGNLLHITMFNLYKPYIGEEVSTDIVDLLKNKMLDSALDVAICEVFKTGDDAGLFEKAKNNILVSPAREYAKKILAADRNYAPFVIYDLENYKVRKNTGDDYFIEYDVNGKTLVLKGIIDRIDIKDNVMRVVDYKTSKIDGTKRRYNENDFWIVDEKSTHRKEALQVLIYSEIMSEIEKEKKYDICPSIISVKENEYNLKTGSGRVIRDIVSYTGELNSGDILRDDVNMNLKSRLAELFDENKAFVQVENEKTCEYCDYNKLCTRNNSKD